MSLCRNCECILHDLTSFEFDIIFNLRPKGYCRHLRLSVCLSVPIILVNTITQSVYPPNLLGGFDMALSWMVL